MRKAKAIELLDARTIVRLKDYKGEAHGIQQPVFTICGYELAKFSPAFDVDVDKELHIYPGDLEDWECDALEADLEDCGVLYYRMGYQGDDEIIFSEFSYNGKYIVHWA